MAVVFSRDIGKAASVQCVDGREGAYEATEWRGNWSLQVEVKGLKYGVMCDYMLVHSHS